LINNFGPPGVLGGTLTVMAVNGEATFSNLTINQTGDYSLLAASNGLGVATTNTFTVTPTTIINPPPTDPLVTFVTNLYRTVLNRDPDTAGLNSWVAGLHAGLTRQQVAQGFLESPEHRGIQVDGYYTTYLHRQADPGGRAAWVNALTHGTDEGTVIFLFLSSPEYTAKHPDATSFVTGLYADLFNRSLDPSGQTTWIPLAQTPVERYLVAAEILNSTEELKRIVDHYYADLLGRPADATGEQAWMTMLNSTSGLLLLPPLSSDTHLLSRDQVAELFLASDEFFAHAARVLPP
jgi:hypothetical protein